jgi:hypothetical protein
MSMHSTTNAILPHNNHTALSSAYAVLAPPHNSIPPNYDYQQVQSYPGQPATQYMQSQNHYYDALVGDSPVMPSPHIPSNSQMISHTSMGDTTQSMDRRDSKHGVLNNSSGNIEFPASILPISTSSDIGAVRASSGVSHAIVPMDFNDNSPFHMMTSQPSYPDYNNHHFFYPPASANPSLAQPPAKRRQTVPVVDMPTYVPQLDHMYAVSGQYHSQLISEHGGIHS